MDLCPEGFFILYVYAEPVVRISSPRGICVLKKRPSSWVFCIYYVRGREIPIIPAGIEQPNIRTTQCALIHRNLSHPIVYIWSHCWDRKTHDGSTKKKSWKGKKKKICVNNNKQKMAAFSRTAWLKSFQKIKNQHAPPPFFPSIYRRVFVCVCVREKPLG